MATTSGRGLVSSKTPRFLLGGTELPEAGGHSGSHGLFKIGHKSPGRKLPCCAHHSNFVNHEPMLKSLGWLRQPSLWLGRHSRITSSERSCSTTHRALVPQAQGHSGGDEAPSEEKQPKLSPAGRELAEATKKRLEAARSKATEYQQSPPKTGGGSNHVQTRTQHVDVGSDDDFDSDSDDEDTQERGGGYGVMAVLLNQKKKKESYYKNASREMSKPAVLPDIEIVRGKKVVSERRFRDE